MGFSRQDALSLARSTGNLRLATAMASSGNAVPAALAESKRHAISKAMGKPASTGKSLELVIANGGGVIEWTKVPNGVQFLKGGKTVPTRSPCDFSGTVIGSGRHIVLDAKQCNLPTSFDASHDKVKPHQVAELIRHGRAGAIAGLLIESTAQGRFHWLNWSRLVEWLPTYQWAQITDLGPSNVAIDWRWLVGTCLYGQPR